MSNKRAFYSIEVLMGEDYTTWSTDDLKWLWTHALRGQERLFKGELLDKLELTQQRVKDELAKRRT
jgi:hypothetical protein